ncbi:hypothetical protein OG787_20615 [Streptomyces sp. NBC_00075]|uniref:hypothetical protein n=1 Tax=Streptomyces sp. NBC_00075 TaxID=2975641 RepID=UPI00324C2C30
MTTKNSGKSRTKAKTRSNSGKNKDKKRGTAGPVVNRVEDEHRTQTASSPQCGARSRLLARITSAVTVGVQLLPHTEHLHGGLQFAAVLLLAIDVVIDLGVGTLSRINLMNQRMKNTATSLGRDAEGNVIAAVKVGASAGRSGQHARITGRTVSAVLVLLVAAAEQPHKELLVAAFAVLAMDTVTESGRTLRNVIRARLG